MVMRSALHPPTPRSLRMRRGTKKRAPRATPEQRLCKAVLAGDVEAVRGLLDDGRVGVDTLLQTTEISVRSLTPHRGGKCELCADWNERFGRRRVESAGGEYRATALHMAAYRGYKKIAELLLDGNADVNARDQYGETPLHIAVYKRHEGVVEELLSRGADVNSRGEFGERPLHRTNFHGAEEIAERLIVAGADINAVDDDENSALHLVAADPTGLVDVLLSHGVDANLRNKRDETALHTVFMGRNLWEVDIILPRLVNYGASVRATDENGDALLHLILCRISDPSSFVGMFESLRIAGMYGAKWDDDCDAILEEGMQESEDAGSENSDGFVVDFSEAEEPRESEPDSSGVSFDLDRGGRSGEENQEKVLDTSDLLPYRYGFFSDSRMKGKLPVDFVSALRVCYSRWEVDFDEINPPTQIPVEEVLKGASAIQMYLEQLDKSPEIEFHRKICIVGPSNWGKTSLVESIVSNKHNLVHPDDRTIGIDQLKLEFREPDSEPNPGRHHKVTFWDFAGQDEYQVAHALFFSRRNLYLLCIDTKAYAITFLQADLMTESSEALDDRMNWYVETRILRWIRLIVARQPDAEFQFIGTKADLAIKVDADSLLDLKQRLANVLGIVQDMAKQNSKRASRVARSNAKPITSLGDPRLKTLKEEPVVDLILSSCSDDESVATIKAQIISLICKSKRSYQLPQSFIDVLHKLKQQKMKAEKRVTSEHVKACFVPLSKLVYSLHNQSSNLTLGDTTSMVCTLRDIGDVLWYDDFDDMLANTVIINPMLIIDLIRQVFNHKYTAEVMYDRKLRVLPLWENLDKEQLLAMKRLLQHFHLAYPAAERDMQVDSDLIMPAFWRSRTSAQLLFMGQTLKEPWTTLPFDWAVSVHWDIYVQSGFEDVLFDRLVVASYNAAFPRDVGPDYFLYGDPLGQKLPYACRLIADWHRTTHKRVLKLEAVLKANSQATEETALWDRFQCVCEALANVFATFPGLQLSVSALRNDDSGDEDARPLLRTCTTPDRAWLPPKPVLSKCVALLTKPEPIFR